MEMKSKHPSKSAKAEHCLFLNVAWTIPGNTSCQDRQRIEAFYSARTRQEDPIEGRQNSE